MKLSNINIQNYKSLGNEEITDPSGLNVLIGKNNSGKSNILSAIDSFFQFFRHQQIACTLSSIGDELDFHHKDTQVPINISCTIELGGKVADLVDSLKKNAPQIENIFKQYPNSSTLTARLTTKRLKYGKSFTYVSLISLNTDTEHNLLEIPEAAAESLYLRNEEIRSLEDEQSAIGSFLRRFTGDDWRLISNELKGGPNSRNLRSNVYRMITRYMDSPSSELASRIEHFLRRSEDYSSFTNSIQKLQDDLEGEKNQLISREIDHDLSTFLGKQNSIPDFYWAIADTFRQFNVLHLRDRRDPIGREEAEKLLQLKVKRGGTKQLDHIQKTVDGLLGVTVDAFAPESAERPTSFDQGAAELDVDNFLITVNGAGIREALRLILDYEFSNPDLLLLEEPEIHLHPGLEVGLMHYLSQISQDCQIFVTTHSSNFLENTDYQNIYFVTKEEATTVSRLTWDQVVEQIPAELGIQLSSLFMFERLIFVEGKTDEIMLRTFADILGYNINKNSVGFINMEGIRNFGNFAAPKILEFLTNRGVRLFFLADRDERDSEAVRAFRDKVGSKGHLFVTEGREIENCFVNRETISRYMQEYADVEIDLDELDEEIEDSCEKLKEFTKFKYLQDALAKPIYISSTNQSSGGDVVAKEEINKLLRDADSNLQERKNSLDEISSQTEEFLATNWEKNKRHIVPGTELLNHIFNKYQRSFKKERDCGRMASVVDKENIDKNIYQLIDRICD